jgi:hypothetical protein
MMGRRGELTVTREQVIAGLNAGQDWTAVSAALDIPAGVAFMIATGIPADGSGVPELPQAALGVKNPASPQSLVNPPQRNPLTNEQVDTWIRQRAARELTQ